MIHHFHSKSPELTIEIAQPKKAGELGEVVKFIAHGFVTDNDDTAKKIKDTKSFKNGFISLTTNSPIAGANKSQVVTGSRGTDNNDLVSQLQKRLQDAEAKIVELKKPKVGRPKKESVVA